MDRDACGDGHLLAEFRPFLIYLACIHLDPRLRGKLDAEDAVQETLLEAHEKRDQFRGENARQRKAWLRQILLHKLANAVEKLRAQKRDANRERPLEDALEKSSVRLGNLLADPQSTPCEKAQRSEQALLLEEALAGLPERQREAVVLKHYHGWTLAEICKHMSATQTAVAGLLNRGLMSLRGVLAEPE